MSTLDGTFIKPYPFVVAIIQARAGGERFPGKIFAKLRGIAILDRVIQRVAKTETVKQIVVATPDDAVVSYVYDKYQGHVWAFKGHPTDVLDRYCKAAKWSGADVVVRITADCPLIDPKLIDACVKKHLSTRCDITTNVLRRTYPKGMDCEVIDTMGLERIKNLTDDLRYHEHVTLYAYEHPALFVFSTIFDSKDYSYFNYCIDTKRDLDKLERLPQSLNLDTCTWSELVEADGEELDQRSDSQTGGASL